MRNRDGSTSYRTAKKEIAADTWVKVDYRKPRAHIDELPYGKVIRRTKLGYPNNGFFWVRILKNGKIMLKEYEGIYLHIVEPTGEEWARYVIEDVWKK